MNQILIELKVVIDKSAITIGETSTSFSQKLMELDRKSARTRESSTTSQSIESD